MNAAVTAFDLRRELATICSRQICAWPTGSTIWNRLRVHAEPDACDRGALHVAQALRRCPAQAEQFNDLARHLAERVVGLATGG